MKKKRICISIFFLLLIVLSFSGCKKEQTPEELILYYQGLADNYEQQVQDFETMVQDMSVQPQPFTIKLQRTYQRKNEEIRKLMIKMDALVGRMQEDVDSGKLEQQFCDEIAERFELATTQILQLRNAMNIMLGMSVSKEDVQEQQTRGNYWFSN